MVFNNREAQQPDDPQELPCGRCVGCRLEKSRQWAMRCIHEKSLHEDSCFITLTYNQESLLSRPNPYSLNVEDFQKFMKRLRKKFSKKTIRFFHCGEYGDKYGRPHYHAIIFGLDFEDKQLYQVTSQGHRLYTSKILESLWPYGFCPIGEVTFESTAYVARYIMKKRTGDDADEHYMFVDPDTGETYQRKPEYITMSRRPGIGKDWFEQFADDVYPKDYITLNGKKMRPPKFYDRCLEQSRPYEFDEVKERRKEAARTSESDNTPERLRVKEQVRQRAIDDKLPRTLDAVI
jgi:hypothetical protein